MEGTVAQIQQPIVVARKANLTNLRLEMDRNRGAEFQTSLVSLVSNGSETRVIRKFEEAQIADASLVQFKIGDYVFGVNRWSLDRFQAKISNDGEV